MAAVSAPVKGHRRAGQKRPLHIDNPLVGTALPLEAVVLEPCHELAVHHHVHLADTRQTADLLPVVAGVKPDGLSRKAVADLIDQPTGLLPVVRVQRVPRRLR